MICLALARFQSPYSALEQLDVRVLGQHRLERRQLVDRGGRAGDRQHGEDLALAAQVLHQVAGDHLAERPLVDIGVGDRAGPVGEAAAGVDRRNALLDRLLQGALDRLLVDRPVEDQVDALADQVLDVGDLLGRVEVGVGDDDLVDLRVARGLVQDVLLGEHDPGVGEIAGGEADGVGRLLLEPGRVDHLLGLLQLLLAPGVRRTGGRQHGTGERDDDRGGEHACLFQHEPPLR